MPSHLITSLKPGAVATAPPSAVDARNMPMPALMCHKHAQQQHSRLGGWFRAAFGGSTRVENKRQQPIIPMAILLGGLTHFIDITL